MATTTLVFGLMFIALGVGGYILTDRTSATALIPAAFGVIFCVLGLLARQVALRRHVMHAAALLGVVAIAGSGRGIPKIFPLIAGEPVDRPAAVISQAVMAGLAIVFVALCIKSFIDARRNRTA